MQVCGTVFGNNPDQLDNGAFAEFVAVPGDLVLKVPAGMSLQTAATLPMGLVTAGMSLYLELKLPLPVVHPAPEPAEKQTYVLVYGGSTATGRIAIQLLRM